MNKLKSKKVWITTDGQEFDSKTEAEKTQRSLDFSEWYCDPDFDGQLSILKSQKHANYVLDEDVQEWLFNNQNEVMKLLAPEMNEMRRKLLTPKMHEMRRKLVELQTHFSNNANSNMPTTNSYYFQGKLELVTAILNALNGDFIELEDQKL